MNDSALTKSQKLIDLIDKYRKRRRVSVSLRSSGSCTGPGIDTRIEMIDGFMDDLEDLKK